jgi:hypothetical protein
MPSGSQGGQSIEPPLDSEIQRQVRRGQNGEFGSLSFVQRLVGEKCFCEPNDFFVWFATEI